MDISPLLRLCDCRCPRHHGYQRTTYHDEGCSCAITCATQPMTLLAKQWGRALFLDPQGDFLWTVPHLQAGQWDWEHASEIDSRSDDYHAGQVIEQKLRDIAAVLDSTQ